MEKIIKTLALAVVVGLATMNFLLVQQNRKLKENLSLTSNKEIRPGEVFKDFYAVNTQGLLTKVNLRKTGQGTVLIYFSYLCPTCRENFDQFIKFSSVIDRHQWKVVWLSVDPNEVARKVFAAKHVSDDVLSNFSCGEYNGLGLRKVPRLIVVRPGGSVAMAWNGRFDQDTWSDVYQFFGAEEKRLANLPMANTARLDKFPVRPTR